MKTMYTKGFKTKESKIKWIASYVSNKPIKRKQFLIIRESFQSKLICLDDFNKLDRANIIRKIFQYKFLISCYNAKNVRCGKRKEYKDTQFLLGEEKMMFRNMHKYRLDLVHKGFDIVEGYIKSLFCSDYAPSIHRLDRKGNYSWDNIDLITNKDHRVETKKEREADAKASKLLV